MNNKTKRRAKRTNRRRTNRRTNRRRTNRRRTNYVGGAIAILTNRLTKRPPGMNMKITGDFESNQSSITIGPAKIKFDSGERYVGPCNSNYNAHGRGKFTFTDGTIYVGDFIDGKKSGRGRIAYENGDVYDGDFLKDAPHGMGTYTTKKGIYKGQLVFGFYQGLGKMTFENGDVYEGKFVKDRIEGAGTLTKIDGTMAQGIFTETEDDGIFLVSEPEAPMPFMMVDPTSDPAQAGANHAILVQEDALTIAHNKAIKRDAIAKSVAEAREKLKRERRLHAAILAGDYNDAPPAVVWHAFDKGQGGSPSPMK